MKKHLVSQKSISLDANRSLVGAYKKQFIPESVVIPIQGKDVSDFIIIIIIVKSKPEKNVIEEKLCPTPL